MTRHRRPGSSFALVVLVAAAPWVAVGCGKKGPPLVPLVIVPAPVDDLVLRRLGDDVHLQFTIPARNQDGSQPADLREVDVYAITGPPVDEIGRPLDARSFARYGTLVARVEVAPPPPPPPEDGTPPPPAPPDPRPKQGERVRVVERWSPAALEPFVHPRRRPEPPVAVRSDLGPVAQPAVSPRSETLRRTYVAVGRNRRGQWGPLSPRLAMPVVDRPAAPDAPVVTYTESALRVEWALPAGARRPIQVAPESGELPVLRVPFVRPTPHAFNVYERPVESETTDPSRPIVPLNAAPLAATAYEAASPRFGEARCYEVRMVEAAAAMTLESEASPPACVTPVDTFPPAAPRGLALVASEGVINLIWEPNTEPDLAGYLVLRGEFPGDRLEALTPAPIRETTFRDGRVTPGTRYVYAIVAVDSASPQNVSGESARVEEIAR